MIIEGRIVEMIRARIVKECTKHGVVEFVETTTKGKPYWRCTKCRYDAIAAKRARTKERSVAYKGGKCELCGYDRCNRALVFHHRDPKEKEFGLAKMSCKSWRKIQGELDKCQLLCSNCHMEVHDLIEKTGV